MKINSTSQQIASTILEAVKTGTAPWQKRWTPEQCITPYNPVSGTVYKGVNLSYLSIIQSIENRPDPRWLTYKQANDNGWQVRRGERGRSIQFWMFDREQVNPQTGEKERVRLERPMLRTYVVFNATQIDGIPALERPPAEEWQRLERADNILNRSGAIINHVQGDKAYYSPIADAITLPERRQFQTADRYYATALHELGHWTGHESRLDRDLKHPFGSREYAYEELVAEIASWRVGMDIGIGHDPEQHAAYNVSWIKILEDKPTAIFKACAEAEKVAEYVIDLEKERTKEQDMENTVSPPQYIIATDSFTIVTPQREFSDLPNAAMFASPAIALRAALEVREQHKGLLDGTELYIHRVDPGQDVHKDPILITGTQQEMAAQWKRRVSPELPDVLTNQEQATPKGTTFLSFCCARDDSDNTFELLDSKGKADGVLRLNCAIMREMEDKTPTAEHLNDEAFDGIVLLRDGKPVEAIVLNSPQLHKSMWAAGKDLEKKYLNVPFNEKDQASERGASWDSKAKSWYIPEGLATGPFTQWLPELSHTQPTSDNPQHQFAQFIEQMGGDLKGSYPEMDGKIHRIPEIGAKPGNKNIAYVGYLDGHPAGWVKNFRGEERRWSMAGVVLTPEDRERLQKEQEEKKAQRAQERQEQYEQKAKESQEYIQGLKQATGEEKYYQDKGIAPSTEGVLVDPRGNIVVPLVDIDGQQWSHVTLQANGFKQNLKDARLQGTFHVIGAANHEAITGAILLVEGYSTGAAVNEATGLPVVVCTSANNLENVAVAMRERHPDQSILILGDNDEYLTAEGKQNQGKVKALAAAAAIDGHTLFPDFGNQASDKSRTDLLDMKREAGLERLHDYITAKLSTIEAEEALEEREHEHEGQENSREAAEEIER